MGFMMFCILTFKFTHQPVDQQNMAKKSSAFKVQLQLSSDWRGFFNDAWSLATAAWGLFSPQFNLLFDNPIKLCLCGGELGEQRRSHKSESWKCFEMTRKKKFSKSKLKKNL